jgi:electron transfer flavoprotein alpha subunit
MTVLCLVERDGAAGGPIDASVRALAVARQLADSAHGTVTAVLFAAAGAAGVAEGAGGAAALAGLAGLGVTEVVVVSAGDGYAPAAWARGLAELAVAVAAAAVVAAATDRGSEVLAHLGAITSQPVAANCVQAAWVGPGDCQLTRHRWAGSLLEDATLEATLALFTVAADAESAVPPGAAAIRPGEPVVQPPEARLPVRLFRPDIAEADLRVRAVESTERAAGVSLATARVVVGGGRGVGGPEGFAVLEELASILGGTLGVSRVVTSQGWRPHRQQVGQTGTKISPELYLACGISGAIQHMAGCLGARHIVAVNTDPGAPIIAHADYAVIGDLAEVIPALVAALRARDD